MSRGQRAAVAFVLLLLFCVLCVSCDGQRRQAQGAENARQNSSAASIMKSSAGPSFYPAGFDRAGRYHTVRWGNTSAVRLSDT